MASRVIMGALATLAGIALVLYVSGFAFLAINKINPLGNADLFTWWEYWRAYPESRPQLHKVILVTVVAIIGLLVAGYIKRQKIPLHGASRFASKMEIQAAGLMGSKGVIVGKAAGRFLMYDSMQFVSLMAPTRSGKGVGIVIPNLLNYPDSIVCLDIKLENWTITSKYRAGNGQDVYLFNPFSTDTHRYNPLGYVSTDPHQRPAEVLAIGYMLYPRGDDRNSMWSDTARDLFVGLCLYMLETPDTVASIGEALRIASGKGKPLKHHLTDLIHARNFNPVHGMNNKGEKVTSYEPKAPYDGTGLPHLSANCVNALNRFISAPDNTAGGILTTFNAPLTLWASPVVDAATSGNDFDLNLLRKRRMSVYVGIPVNKLAEAGVLLRLFFSQLVNINTAELFGSNGNTVPCLLLLDEFMAPRYIPIIAEGSAYIAGYGLRLLTIAQSKAQVSKPIADGGYGREGATALFTNHALNILYTPKELTDANEYSETLGYDTVKSQSRNIRKRMDGTESDQRRALMLPQELLRMNQNTQIIQLESVRPIKCQKIRYYSETVFINRLKTVSPSLARLGKKLPTEQQLQAAWTSGELSAHVPTVNIDLFEAKQHNRTRAMTSNDVAGGIELESVAIDLSAITAPTDDPMSDEQVQAYVGQFWGSLGETESEPAPDNVDLETGEWIEPENDLIDVSALRA